MKNETSKAFIIGLTDTGEKIAAASGRISTQDGNVSDILAKSQDEQKNANLISKVTKSGHNSTIEHTVYNIAFQDVSVFVEQFMIEYRLASFTVKSRRYVNFGSCGYYIPDLDEKHESVFKKTVDAIYDDYNFLIEKGIPKEDARFVLPYCLKSNFFCTVNAREMLHILRGMLFGRGSRFNELHDLGEQLLNQIRKLTPGICTDFEERKPQLSDKINLGYRYNNFITESENKNKVELLSYTKDAEKTIAKSALISTRQYNFDTVENIIQYNKNVSEIIKTVLDSSRPRPLESASYTFRLNGVSLSTITHFSRHRIHGLIVPSLTLTDRTKYIIPETVKQNKESLERYISSFDKMIELYNSFRKDGISDELLVYCQLSGNTLDIISTMNARELLLFFKLRSCNRAQWEIREYAIEMLKQLREIQPDLFGFYGPSCYVSACPEGRLSCGEAVEVKKYFSEL